jgi:hypothetical protein
MVAFFICSKLRGFTTKLRGFYKCWGQKNEFYLGSHAFPSATFRSGRSLYYRIRLVKVLKVTDFLQRFPLFL